MCDEFVMIQVWKEVHRTIWKVIPVLIQKEKKSVLVNMNISINSHAFLKCMHACANVHARTRETQAGRGRAMYLDTFHTYPHQLLLTQQSTHQHTHTNTHTHTHLNH
jgi:hypothetical protein